MQQHRGEFWEHVGTRIDGWTRSRVARRVEVRAPDHKSKLVRGSQRIFPVRRRPRGWRMTESGPAIAVK
jgi:hypothetical protein